jgi:hypothetical protein
MKMTANILTRHQLRTPVPNPWEVAWVLWHYTDDTHFYYLALKPNGWELGKEDPAYPGAQRYLATGSDRKFPIGSWYSTTIVQRGAVITFTDGQRPYRSGHAGLYNEDADVRFDRITAYSL